MPARSTVDSGRRVTVATNSSRSWANTVSPSTIAARRADRVSTAWASDGGDQQADRAVDRPDGRAGRDAVDQGAEQPRAGQPGQGGDGVQHDRPRQAGAVLAAAARGCAGAAAVASATGSARLSSSDSAAARDTTTR